MLARWFDRSGIGQILAPDPDAAPVSENDESRSAVWQFLAPDENFAPHPQAPPSQVFPPHLPSEPSLHGGINPYVGKTPLPPPVSQSSSQVTPQTPQTPQPEASHDTEDQDLHARVLSACRDTHRFMGSPMPERKVNDKFLRLCGSTKPLSEKLQKRMRSMVESDGTFQNHYLLRVRATRMGESAPDGYTPLMVAAYAGHLAAAELILQLAKDYAASSGKDTYKDLHLDRDMFGGTALHIAGERGHVEMVQFLLPLYTFASPEQSSTTTSSTSAPNNNNHNNTTAHVPLVDLGGQTAFGRAVTSPCPKAKNNKRSLEKHLFSNQDLSIFGKAKPLEERMGSIPSLGLEYGMSDMPGMRGYMEDALSVAQWTQDTNSIASGNHDTNSNELALFCVCDGHGDHGKVSEFLVKHAQEVLQTCIDEREAQHRADHKLVLPSQEYWSAVWETASLRLDRKLHEAHLTEGGSTGVFCLVTNQEIVVANVGDSRCILASKAPPAPSPMAVSTETTTTAKPIASAEEATTHETAEATAEEAAEETTETAPEGTTETAEAAATTTTAETADVDAEAPPALVEEPAESSSSVAETKPTTTTAGSTVVVTALSEDHKPNLPDEAARVRMAGFDVQSIPIVEEDGTETVIHKVVKDAKEQLAVSRAFGDFDYKANTQLSELEQAIVPLADVTVHTRNPTSDLYVVLACDGIWDVMSNDEVVEVIQTQVPIKQVYSPESILPDVADVLLQECLGKESRDNLSAIIVSLQPNHSKGANADAAADAMTPKALDFGSPK